MNSHLLQPEHADVKVSHVGWRSVLVAVAVFAVSFLSISLLERTSLSSLEEQMHAIVLERANLALTLSEGISASSIQEFSAKLRAQLRFSDVQLLSSRDVTSPAMAEALLTGSTTAEDISSQRSQTSCSGYAPLHLEGQRYLVKVNVPALTFIERCRDVKQRAWFAEGIMCVFAFLSGFFFWRAGLHREQEEREREASRKRLLVSEEMYRTLFEASGSGIVVYDHNGMICMINHVAEELFGWRREEVEGKRRVLDFVSPEDRPAVEILLRKKDWNNPSASVNQVEYGLLRRDDTRLQCLMLDTRIPGSDRSVCSILDRTRLVETSRQLEESQRRYQTIIQEANTPIIVFERGNRIVLANNECLRMAQTTDGSFVGHSWTEFVAPEELSRVLELQQGFSGKSGPWHLMLQICDKTGRKHHLNAVISRLPGSTNCVVIGVDITDRIMAEEALQQLNSDLDKTVQKRTAELELALRSRDDFLSATSHELRTPLQAILAAVEILLDPQMSKPLDEHQSHQVDVVKRSASYLLSLISDILDLAKAVSGKFQLHCEPTDADIVCHEALEMVNTMAASHRLNLHYDLKHPVVLNVDPLRLRQILVNLLSNAVKFTPAGGDVWLEADADTRLHQAVFRVRDNGIGISEENQKKLFKPFVQLDNSLSRAHSGTGLGLSLVRRLALAHGGDTQLESVSGQGTTITVTLPWDESLQLPERVLSQSSAVDVKAVEGEIRVLLAEDNADIRDSLCEYLEVQGCRVQPAENGKIAVDHAMKDDYDVVLMDVQMPVMDGFTAIHHLRSEERTKDLPIIAMTAMVQSEDARRCLDAGATSYLSKPVHLKNVIAAVRQFARGTENPDA